MAKSKQIDVERMLVQKHRRYGVDQNFSVYLALLSRGMKLAAVRKWFVQELCVQAMLQTHYDEREASRILGISVPLLRKYLIDRIRKEGQ